MQLHAWKSTKQDPCKMNAHAFLFGLQDLSQC